MFPFVVSIGLSIYCRKPVMFLYPSLSGLPIHPIARWENTLDIKATKYLSTTLSFQLYYNRAQNVDVQTQIGRAHV